MAYGSVEWLCQTPPHVEGQPQGCTNDEEKECPLGEADLDTIMLASVPMAWHNQYNLTQTMVPESTCALLPNLEAIEQVLVEKQQDKLKAKGKTATARPEAKSNPNWKVSWGLTGQVPKKGCSEKFC